MRNRFHQLALSTAILAALLAPAASAEPACVGPACAGTYADQYGEGSCEGSDSFYAAARGALVTAAAGDDVYGVYVYNYCYAYADGEAVTHGSGLGAGATVMHHGGAGFTGAGASWTSNVWPDGYNDCNVVVQWTELPGGFTPFALFLPCPGGDGPGLVFPALP